MIIRFKVLTIIKKLNQLQLYKDTYTFTVDDTISTIRHKNTMILGSSIPTNTSFQTDFKQLVSK